jgi:hypothetical protein
MRTATPVRVSRITSFASGQGMRVALVAWLGQRVLLLGLIWAVQAATSHPTLQSVYRVWIGWDASHYAEIARGGYQEISQAAFYPLFPLLEHLLAPLVGGSPEIAGIVIANAASLGAFLALYALVERDLNRHVARRTLLYLVLFPSSMYLVAAYTESLFLLLCLGMFLALRAGSWALAGLLAALATLSRGVGLALLLPLAVAVYEALRLRWDAYSARKRWRAGIEIGVAVLLPLVAYAGVQIMFDRQFGLADAQQAAEVRYWGRSLDWPWTGLVRSAQMVISGSPSAVAVNLVFALLWLGLAISMARSLIPNLRGLLRNRLAQAGEAGLAPTARYPNDGLRFGMMFSAAWALPRDYVAYTWGALLLVLLTPVHGQNVSPFVSAPRYMLVAFPCFVLVALWSMRSRWLHYGLLAVSLGDLILSLLLFARGGFVA